MQLARLDADRGWFLEAGYLEPPKSRAIRSEVAALADELRPLAVTAVDAWGIPAAL
ncbi:MAG: acyl-CoA dehydrogenase [Longimicrobiales bacterium]|nr:acyl-CoA dehydrogenase [Longimicrobiales bacterium]